MTPTSSIALSYGLVALTLLLYTRALRRRIHHAQQARHHHSDPKAPDR